MVNLTEKRVGIGLGLLGGCLILLGSFLAAVVGLTEFAFGRPFAGMGSASFAAVLFVVGLLALLFTWLAYRSWSERPMTSGIMLIALAAVGWVSLGLGTNVFALLGGLFVFLSGVLLLVEPARQAAHAVAAA